MTGLGIDVRGTKDSRGIMDIGKIERDIAGLKELKKSDDRLILARKLKKDLSDAEAECARDFSIPFDEVLGSESRFRLSKAMLRGWKLD